jgi:arabinogalactan endo-1,4-beta-galactosidase
MDIVQLGTPSGTCNAELVAWNGEESTEGSPWENQALFDFNNQALPVIDVLKSSFRNCIKYSN